MQQLSVLDQEFERLLIRHRAWDCWKKALEFRLWWIVSRDAAIFPTVSAHEQKLRAHLLTPMPDDLKSRIQVALDDIGRADRDAGTELLDPQALAQQADILDQILENYKYNLTLNDWESEMEALASQPASIHKLFLLCSPTGDGYLHGLLYKRFRKSLSTYCRTVGEAEVDDWAEDSAIKVILYGGRKSVIAKIIERTPNAVGLSGGTRS